MGEWKEGQEPVFLICDDGDGDADGDGEKWNELGPGMLGGGSDEQALPPMTWNSLMFPIVDSVGVVGGHHFSPQTTRLGLINRKLAPM